MLLYHLLNIALLRSRKPSRFFWMLRRVGIIKIFPELQALIGAPQHPWRHPEGDVWNHTMMVLDNARELMDNLSRPWRKALMYAALLHDVGKPSSTQMPELTAYGHDVAGGPIARRFLERITKDETLIDRVESLVINHMQLGHLYRGEAKEKAWRRLSRKVNLLVLSKLARADSAGRPGRDLYGHHGPADMAVEYYYKFKEDQQ